MVAREFSTEQPDNRTGHALEPDLKHPDAREDRERNGQRQDQEDQRDERLHAAAAEQAALPAAVPAELVGNAAEDTWAALDMDSKRAALTALVTITILPSGSGKAFDPELVRATWRN